jgi:hypothetical protein
VGQELTVINLKKYPVPQEIVTEIARIHTGSDMRPPSNIFIQLPHEYVLLGMKAGRVAAVLLGRTFSSDSEKAGCFEVTVLCVRLDLRSTRAGSSSDNVGTEMLFAAMKKAKKLGKRFLILSYKSACSGPKLSEENCVRRVAFYIGHFRALGIPVEYKESEEYYNEDSGDVYQMQYVRYDLEEFDYLQSRERLVARRSGLRRESNDQSSGSDVAQKKARLS